MAQGERVAREAQAYIIASSDRPQASPDPNTIIVIIVEHDRYFHIL